LQTDNSGYTLVKPICTSYRFRMKHTTIMELPRLRYSAAVESYRQFQPLEEETSKQSSPQEYITFRLGVLMDDAFWRVYIN
jgi:hypothetical protein